MAEEANGKFNSSRWWAIAPFVISSVMGIAFAYGTSLATNAALRADITALQKDNAELHKQQDYYRDSYISNKEFKIYVDGMTQQQATMQRMLEDIRNHQK